jgi:hypothetical protein
MTTLIMDSKKRVSLRKLLQFDNVQSLEATVQSNGNIVLKPMTSIPAREQWLYKNKKALKSVQKGLEQKGTISRGSFAKYAED